MSTRGKCKNCGVDIFVRTKCKPRQYCSDKCRSERWNRHHLAKKKNYPLICNHCGKEFTANGNKQQKCGSRDCYIKARMARWWNGLKQTFSRKGKLFHERVNYFSKGYTFSRKVNLFTKGRFGIQRLHFIKTAPEMPKKINAKSATRQSNLTVQNSTFSRKVCKTLA